MLRVLGRIATRGELLQIKVQDIDFFVDEDSLSTNDSENFQPYKSRGMGPVLILTTNPGSISASSPKKIAEGSKVGKVVPL